MTSMEEMMENTAKAIVANHRDWITNATDEEWVSHRADFGKALDETFNQFIRTGKLLGQSTDLRDATAGDRLAAKIGQMTTDGKIKVVKVEQEPEPESFFG